MAISIPHGLHWGAACVATARAASRQANRLPAMLAIVLSCVLLAFVCLCAVGAQSGPHEANLERHVKAAFLYKFLGYVDYPQNAMPAAGEPLVIAILGADEVAEELARISAGRSMNGRVVAERKLRPGETPGKVHMLFVGDIDVGDIEKALAAVRQAPVLTVTESGCALRQDSVINFRVVDERVRFEVSLDAAEKNHLKLSSRLLAVACKVQRSSSRSHVVLSQRFAAEISFGVGLALGHPEDPSMSKPYDSTQPERDAIDALPGTVALEFGTDWCGYCKAAAPVIAAALAEQPAVSHIKVEDGSGRKLGRSFKVKLWPTLVILKDGKELARVVRPTERDEVRTALEPAARG